MGSGGASTFSYLLLLVFFLVILWVLPAFLRPGRWFFLVFSRRSRLLRRGSLRSFKLMRAVGVFVGLGRRREFHAWVLLRRGLLLLLHGTLRLVLLRWLRRRRRRKPRLLLRRLLSLLLLLIALLRLGLRLLL